MTNCLLVYWLMVVLVHMVNMWQLYTNCSVTKSCNNYYVLSSGQAWLAQKSHTLPVCVLHFVRFDFMQKIIWECRQLYSYTLSSINTAYFTEHARFHIPPLIIFGRNAYVDTYSTTWYHQWLVSGCHTFPKNLMFTFVELVFLKRWPRRQMRLSLSMTNIFFHQYAKEVHFSNKTILFFHTLL